jgi:cytochrome c-type biogenesis protein CcmH
MPSEAGEARAHRLPPVPMESDGAATMSSPAAAATAGGTTVRGEVSLAETLRARAKPGMTLFVVAKSIASPGPPVAVLRRSVGEWPLEFSLDDTQSMLPGRNLSSMGRVVIEARISRGGQAIPAPGDLAGSTGPIDPADHRPLTVLIDHVVQ